jgi:peptidoglycan hydrolase-like protein with peptidoglycan-binding domain
MSNLLKSKFLTGVMVVAVLFFGAVALSAKTAEAADCSTFTSTLRQGMNNSQVKCLQQTLNEKGFTVSATGAGAMGLETSYFGPRTKAAVMSFQSSMGLVVDGIFGPISRAAIATSGGSMSMTYPAGCSSSSGFSTTTGQSCSSGSMTMTYPAGCTATTTYSATTGQLCSAGTTTTTTTQTGPVTATLSSDNPVSGTLVAGQATADLAHFAFNGSGTVTGVTLQRLGVSADTTPSNVYLFNGATRLTDAASVANNGMVTFTDPSGLFTVNGPMVLSVRSDIAASTSGQTVGFMLASFTTSAGTVNANLSGNIHTVAAATLATVVFGTVTPTGATLNPGPAVTLWQSTLTVSNRDVLLKRFSLRNVGSAQASAFANFKLYVNGVVVGTAVGLDINGYVTFDLMASPVTLVSGSRVVRVESDIVSGASRTVNFSVRNAADADFVDSSFGVNVAATTVPAGPAGNNTISGTSGGTLTIEKDSSSPSGDVTLSGNDVVLAVYKVTAFGESIKIENGRFTFAASNGAVGSLRNGRIMIGGVQYGSTATLNEDSQGTPYTQYTLNYTVVPGVPVLVEQRADIFDNDGTNSLVATDTIIGEWSTGSSNAQRLDSLGSFNAPAADVNANTTTARSASITLTKNATYANQNTDLPATAFKIGSWNLDGSSVEDVLLTTLGFEVDEVTNATFSEADLTSMYVVVKDSSGNVVYSGTPLATVAATSNNFSLNYNLVKNASVTIELYSNLGSTVTASDSFNTGLVVTGTALVSGTAVTAAEVTGQTIIYAAASITATQDASTPVASNAYDNQTVTAAAFKFDAVTAAYDITDITFTLANATVASQVQLYDGVTLVASKSGAATVTFNGLAWNIPANTNKVLTVKLVLVGVGIGGGTSGSSQLVTLTAFTADNKSTGVSAAGTESNPAGKAMYAYAAVPTIVRQNLPTTVLAAGTQVLAKFDVVSSGGTIAWKQILFDITKIAAPTIASVELWDVTGGGNTIVTAAEVFQNGTGGVATTCSSDNTVCELLITVGTDADDNVEEQVSGTKSYEVRATIAGTLAAANSITTSIQSNLAYAASAIFTTAENDNTVDDATFVWSDQSAASHDTGTADWVNESLVKTLPTATWTMTFPN